MYSLVWHLYYLTEIARSCITDMTLITKLTSSWHGALVGTVKMLKQIGSCVTLLKRQLIRGNLVTHQIAWAHALQVHRYTVVLGYLGHNMSTPPQTKGKNLSLEGLECLTWCGTSAT